MGAVSSILRTSAAQPVTKEIQHSIGQRTATAATAAAAAAAKADPLAPKSTQSLKTERLSTAAAALAPNEQQAKESAKKKKKTLAEADAELREKMAGLRGDGGDAGLELEGGQPVAMKRGVKNNMFRYI